MAGLYPLSRMQQFDRNGRPMSGARLFLFDGGTSTPRVGFRDSSLTSPLPNPILADSTGRLPLIYLDDGFYRHRLTTKTGTVIFDDDGLPVISSTVGGSGTSVDPDAVFKTRDIKIRFDDQPLAGYVRLNGRTIGSASSGATERANADTQSLYEELWGFANIAVSGGKGASDAVDFAANKPLVLPNAAGRALTGMDDMGSGAQGVVTSAIVPGYNGGAQSVTIQFNNLPVNSPWTATASTTGTTSADGDHQHQVTGQSGGISALHNHSFGYNTAANKNVTLGTGGTLIGQIWGGGDSVVNSTTGTESVDHTHGVNITSSSAGIHQHTVNAATTVTMQANGGGGQAMGNLAPFMTFMIYIRL